MKIFILLSILIIHVSCSNKPCREVSTVGVPDEIIRPDQNKKIFVFQYDGTKQCGDGLEISLESMSKQLLNIRIYSMTKKNDGQMRIQVCGAPTGQANVYEIDLREFDKAKKMGFQEWKF